MEVECGLTTCLYNWVGRCHAPGIRLTQILDMHKDGNTLYCESFREARPEPPQQNPTGHP